MKINKLKLFNFRNFNDFEISFPSNFVVFEGKNGIGKTSILESVYLLCTGKSQKRAKKKEIIKFGSEGFYAEGEFFSSLSGKKKIALSYGGDGRTSYFIDDTKTTDFFKWFGHRPVVSFSSEDTSLVSGAPEIRRRHFDIVCSFIEPEYLQKLFDYRYWFQRKNSLLCNYFDKIQCDVYDERLAETGSDIILKRVEIIDRIRPLFSSVYNEISGFSESADVVYQPSLKCVYSSKNECKNVFYTTLCANRDKDRQIGFSSIGPHRDEFKIYINGKEAKVYGSLGQNRSVSLSLKLSSSICIENYCHDPSIFLIDDAVSDLDSERTDVFLKQIKQRGQIFMATPLGKLPKSNDYHYMNISDFI